MISLILYKSSPQSLHLCQCNPINRNLQHLPSTHNLQTTRREHTFSTPGILTFPPAPPCVCCITHEITSCVCFSSSYKLSGSVAFLCNVDWLGFVFVFVIHSHIWSIGNLSSSYIIVKNGLSHRFDWFGSSYRNKSSLKIWSAYGVEWDLFHSSQREGGTPVCIYI